MSIIVIRKQPFASRPRYYIELAARIAFIFSGPALILHHPLYLLVWFLGLYLLFKGWIAWPVYDPNQQSAHANHVQKPW